MIPKVIPDIENVTQTAYPITPATIEKSGTAPIEKITPYKTIAQNKYSLTNTLKTQDAKRDLIFALDPVSFAAHVVDFDLDTWQVRALRSPAKRQIFNCTRQAGKSTTAAIKALHRAIYFPRSLVLLVSPSLRQSSELFRKVTDLTDHLPTSPRLTEDNRLSLTMQNGSRIVSLPGKEETIRGYSGASLIIEDEASRVPDDLYRAVRPMLAVSRGQLILMSTPFGKRGHFHDEWTNEEPAWERIMIPASACPRITPEFLEEERRSMGDWWYRQEYECQFVQTVDTVFDYEMVMSAVSDEVKPLFAGVEK
jgi:Terminase-like family.